MDVVMATSGIVLKTIASVRVFSINDYDIYINSFINNYNENTISSWENNVPVIQVRFFQNAIQVTLVWDVQLVVLIRYMETIVRIFAGAHQWSSVILCLDASKVSMC